MFTLCKALYLEGQTALSVTRAQDRTRDPRAVRCATLPVKTILMSHSYNVIMLIFLKDINNSARHSKF